MSTEISVSIIQNMDLKRNMVLQIWIILKYVFANTVFLIKIHIIKRIWIYTNSHKYRFLYHVQIGKSIFYEIHILDTQKSSAFRTLDMTVKKSCKVTLAIVQVKLSL